jgi:hypothetical protein
MAQECLGILAPLTFRWADFRIVTQANLLATIRSCHEMCYRTLQPSMVPAFNDIGEASQQGRHHLSGIMVFRTIRNRMV